MLSCVYYAIEHNVYVKSWHFIGNVSFCFFFAYLPVIALKITVVFALCKCHSFIFNLHLIASTEDDLTYVLGLNIIIYKKVNWSYGLKQ